MRTLLPAVRAAWLSKKIVVCLICLCLFCSCLCSACGVSVGSHSNATDVGPTPQAGRVNTLVTAGELTVGSFTQYPPQEYVDPQTGQIQGFDVDLAHALADQLHLRSQVVSADFSSLIDDLLDRRYDVVISAIAMTPELQKKVNVIPYFRGGEALLVRAGNPDQIEQLSNLCGHAVAVMTNTFELQELQQVNTSCTKAHASKVQLQVVTTQSAAFDLLRTDRVSAFYADSAITDYGMHLYPHIFAQGGNVINATVEGIVVRKEDTLTLRSLRTALQTLQKNKTYHALIVKWGLYNGDITTVPPPFTHN